jgi:hypothetical protein
VSAGDRAIRISVGAEHDGSRANHAMPGGHKDRCVVPGGAADRTNRPGWARPDQVHRSANQETTDWPMAAEAASAGEDIDAAAVAAYRASLDTRQAAVRAEARGNVRQDRTSLGSPLHCRGAPRPRACHGVPPIAITNALAAGPIEVTDASSRFYPVDEIHPAKFPQVN